MERAATLYSMYGSDKPNKTKSKFNQPYNRGQGTAIWPAKYSVISRFCGIAPLDMNTKVTNWSSTRGALMADNSRRASHIFRGCKRITPNQTPSKTVTKTKPISFEFFYNATPAGVQYHTDQTAEESAQFAQNSWTCRDQTFQLLDPFSTFCSTSEHPL